MENKREMFFKELTELTNKYGFSIGGCGCCGSPWVRDVNTGEYIADDLCYDESEKKYEYYDVLNRK